MADGRRRGLGHRPNIRHDLLHGVARQLGARLNIAALDDLHRPHSSDAPIHLVDVDGGGLRGIGTRREELVDDVATGDFLGLTAAPGRIYLLSVISFT